MIRWTCACNAVLKAPERLAGATSRCPACMAAVVVPSQPSTARADAEVKAADGPDLYALGEVTPCTVAPSLPAVSSTCYVPASLHRSEGAPSCDPTVGAIYVGIISGVLALLTALFAGLYPWMLSNGIASCNTLLGIGIWAAVVGLVLGHGCRFLDAALEYGVQGGAHRLREPEWDCGAALTSLCRWGLWFAASPALWLYLAVRYWVHCGDPRPLDVLILAELTVLAITGWAIGLVVLALHPESAWVAPRAWLKVARRLGWRVGLFGVGLAAVGFVHLWCGLQAIAALRNAWLVALILLWMCWFSGWQCCGYALRHLGLQYHHCRQKQRANRDADSLAQPVGSHS